MKRLRKLLLMSFLALLIRHAGNFYDKNAIEEINTQIYEWNGEDFQRREPNEGVFEAWLYQKTEEIRMRAAQQRNIAINRMLRLKMSRLDTHVYEIGDKVVRRVHTDANARTRTRGLFDHYDYYTFK